MTWLKIDDAMPEHPKLEHLSVQAKWARVELLCYCARNLTDGHVPSERARRMATPRVLTELVSADLVHRNGTGWVMHDYLDWNPSREEVLKQREIDRERMRNLRAKRKAKP